MDFSNESEQLKYAQIHVYKHLNNYLSSMALKSAVELGIADTIHKQGKPMTLSELASSLRLHPSKLGVLHRFMRLLTHNGFFIKTTVSSPHVKDQEGEKEETAYGLTLSSKLLVRSKPTSLASIVELAFHPSTLNMWNSSKKLFTDDDNNEVPLFERVTGESYWDALNSDSGFLSVFQESMAADSRILKLGLQTCKHVFEGLGSLVDVGGGTGGFTRLIHEAFPHLKCTVLDQPHVVANLIGSQNLNFVGGNMFNFIPSADAVLLKWVLHDWNDELSIKILKKCKEAISGKGKNGKVIIIDVVIDETDDDHELTDVKLDFDLVMLALFNGKEREKKEWEKLIYEAGFNSYKITPAFGFKSLIEVYP